MKMQESRRRMSRSASGFEGICRKHNKNQRFTSRLSLDSQFFTDGSKDNDNMFIFESGRRSSVEKTGLLSMKKLLAKEEISPKKQTLSVVAKLMGVEGLPSPTPVDRQQRRSSNFYQQKNDSLSAQMCSQVDDAQRFRSSVDRQVFKDVYEDTKASHVVNVNRRCSLRLNKRSVLAIQQRLFDAQEQMLSSDESIQGMEDLVMKRSIALQVDSKGSYGSPIAVLKPLRSEKCGSNAKMWLPERHIKHRGSSLDEGTEENTLPTRIVLLKPKQGKIKNSWSKEVSRQMITRDSSDESVDAKDTGYGGYIGDESSYEESETDSGSDSEILQSPCRKPLWGSDSYTYPSSSIGGSSKKPQCESWKVNHKHHGFEMVRNDSTLAEMRDFNPTAKHIVGGVNIQFSSREDWKDDTTPSSSRARLLSKSYGGISKKKCTHQIVLAKDHLFEVSSFCGRKLDSCQHRNVYEAGCSENANLKIQVKIASTSVVGEAVCNSPMLDIMTVNKPESITLPSNQLSDLQVSSPGEKVSNLQVLHCSCPSGLPRAEPDSSQSCKEANHPSLESVLEVPRREDTSLLESFERVNAELHELRKQLLLLKMDSTTNAEPPHLLPIEEDTNSPVSDNFFEPESESWQTSYAADVLSMTALGDLNFSFPGSNWNYPNDPLDPKMFDELETKYNNGMMGTKSERKLLFDIVKLSLLKIFQDHVDSFPWVRPKPVNLFGKSDKEAVFEGIDEQMTRDFFSMETSKTEELDKEMEWSDAEGEINLIGNEMECLFIDEMISELCFLY